MKLYENIPVPTLFLIAEWVPMLVSLAAAGVCAWLFVLCYGRRCRQLSELPAAFSAALSVFVGVLAACQLPLDVFTAAGVKSHSSGQPQPWAVNGTTVVALLHTTTLTYYVLFGAVIVCSFFVLPFTFFYAEPIEESQTSDDDELPLPQEQEEVGLTRRVCVALLNATLCAVLALSVGACSLLLPGWSSYTPHSLTLSLLYNRLETNVYVDACTLVLYVLAVVGLLLLACYAGLGLSMLPVQLLRGLATAENSLHLLRCQRASLQSAIADLRDQTNYSTFPNWQSYRLKELRREEQQLLQSELKILQRMRTWWYKCLMVRPLEVLLGITAALFGVLFFVSLLFTNIDRAVYWANTDAANSSGQDADGDWTSGGLGSPLDWLLLQLSRRYPLDLLAYGALVVVLIGASLTATHQLGVGCCFRCQVACDGTGWRALALLALLLLCQLVAVAPLMLAVAPRYTMFGAQFYQRPVDNSTSTPQLVQVLPCTLAAPADRCVLSRLALLLLALTCRATLLDTLFYGCCWLLLVSIGVGFCVVMILLRWSCRQLGYPPEQLQSALAFQHHPPPPPPAAAGAGDGQ